MAHAAHDQPPVRSVVVGHEAASSGTTTVCLHIAAALLAQGQRAAIVEFEGCAPALAQAMAKRSAAFASRCGPKLSLPTHLVLGRSPDSADPCAMLEKVMAKIERAHDFVILDASSLDQAARRIVYSFADTLVMPLTLAQLDLALDAHADSDLFASGGFREIAWTVRAARRDRRMLDGGEIDWVVLRNRLAPDAPVPFGRLHALSARAALEFGFRLADGLSERPVYRAALASGLTLFEQPSELLPRSTPGSRLTNDALEAWSLIERLNLPINTASRRRADRHAAWAAAALRPLAMDDLLVP